MKRDPARWAWRRVCCGVLPACLAAACSPTFDWRATRLDDTPLEAMFPCRPDRHERVVNLLPDRRPSAMRMAVCSAGRATFALSAADLADPLAAPAGLKQLRTAALANVGGANPSEAPWRLAGATPIPETVRVTARGKLPDGTEVIEHAVFFAQGAKVYQASVIGVKPDVEAVETFFAGLNFKP